MPPSISSLHSRTVTISSSPLSSTFSSIRTPSLRGHGSATGSLSTISSGPFVHADALDTTILWIPSYYLDDSGRQLSTIRAPRRNAVAVHTPSSSIFSNKVNLLPHGLVRLIRTSDLEQSHKDMLLAMVRMIVYISRQLFPSSHILRDDVARDVKNIALDVCDFLDLILEKLEQRLDTASSAKDQLSNHNLEGEIALEEVVRWVDIIDGLHKPSDIEAKIFRRIATLYDEYIYMPFLQLHRQAPDHNMYHLLDTFLEAICVRLRSIIADTTNADALVRDVEKALDIAAMAHAKKVPRRHIPSQSMPVARYPRMPGLRRRENTL